MSEPKRQKTEAKEDKEEVDRRIFSATHLIKVDTTPPVYLQTSLISKSSALTNLTHSSMKDSAPEVNEFGDKCVVCVPHGNIPYGTWKILELLIDDNYNKGLGLINNNTLDDLFYICFAYDIPFTMISELDYSGDSDMVWKKLPVVILEICELKCKQYFPKTENVPQINTNYTILGEMFHDYLIYKYINLDKRLTFLGVLTIIAPIYNVITLKLCEKALNPKR